MWRAFADTIPCSHYEQDPDWASVERARARRGVRCPVFFWGEADGRLCLTAIGVRRRLPVPGRFFWEFNNGPNVADPDVLSDWLTWLPTALGSEAARIHVQPPFLLSDGGDAVETLLETCGFRRRRTLGLWATLRADLDQDEDALLASFRQETRRALRKSVRQGVTITAEDAPAGWRALALLQGEISQRSPAPDVGVDEIAAVSRHWLRGGAGGTVLVARCQGDPIAAALLVLYRGCAYVPVIPSSRRYSKQPASHLLVWEAMRWAKRKGCSQYDLVGYSMTAQPGDPLWGVNQFKRGFVSLEHLQRRVAVHEKACSPLVVRAAGAARRLQARMSHRRHTAGA